MGAKTRHSGIELLKLVAMLMIVLSHTGPYYGGANVVGFVDFRGATTDINHLIMVLFLYLGQLGNAIFLVCSFFFLLDSKEWKGQKVVSILADCQILSLGFLAVILLSGISLTKGEILKQFFPTTFEYCWFVGCYLLIYMIHPLLNKLIGQMSQKALFSVCTGGIILYSFVQMLVRDSFYYNRLVGFLLFYFLMAYCKKYLSEAVSSKRRNLVVLILSVIGFVLFLVALNILGLHTDTFQYRMLEYCIFVNPLLILIAFSSFFLCKEWKFENKGINFVASLTLYVYVIHENHLFANYVRPKVFTYIYESFGYDRLALYAFLFAVVCYLGAIIVALVYKYTVGKVVGIVCKKIVRRLSAIYTKCYEKLEGLH